MVHLDPVTEYIRLADWMRPLLNKSITPKRFRDKLQKHLVTSHPIRVRLYPLSTDKLDPDDFTIGAEYDPDLDQSDRKHMMIQLYVSAHKRDDWLITEDLASRFILELTEVLVHEYQHQRQYRKRGYRYNSIEEYKSKHNDPDTKAEQEYLGSPDELDAYSANIAARLYIQRELLNKNVTVKSNDSMDLKLYQKTFGKSHPVVKDLVDRIQQNLKFLEDVKNGKAKRYRVGRPYVRRTKYS